MSSMTPQSMNPAPRAPKRKLKDSCSNCSRAKVRCGKNKPQCTRCEDRGLSCVYLASQRSGRRSALLTPPSPSAAGSNTSHSSLQRDDRTRTYQVTYESHTSIVSLGFDNSSAEFVSVPNFSASPFNDFSAGINTLDQGYLSESVTSPWNTTDSSPEDLNGSPFDSLGSINKAKAMDDIGTGSLDQWTDGARSDFTNMDDPFLWMPATPTSVMTPFNFPSPPPTAAPEQPLNTLQHQFREPELLGHCCIQQATTILNALDIKSTTCVEATSNQRSQRPLATTVNQVINANRASIKCVANMLRCSCSRDEQLLIQLTLIISRIIAWYNVAASSENDKENSYNILRKSIEHTHHKPEMNGYPNLGAEDSRSKAQVILGDLDLVVRLVELLSKCFQETRDSAARSISLDDEGMNFIGGWISASVFVQIESDLRRRLRTVTKGVMVITRRAG